MYETLNITAVTAPQAAVIFAIAIGLVFGALAERSKFCFRRALIGEDRKQAAGVWAAALAVAMIGSQTAVAAGWISFDGHRLLTSDLPVLAITAGGLLFGAGMVLTRGCASRLTVLTGSGNLRALSVLILFAIVAHATLKGVLAPLRVALGSVTLPVGDAASLAALPGGVWVWTGLIALGAAVLALRSGAARPALLCGALIGALVPLAWAGTGYVLYDEFDPIALQSLSFTAPWSEALFWSIASTAIPAGFGTGLVGGVLLGSLLSSLIFGAFQWQSFTSPAQTGRYLTGAALMGVGGVLAGGCTVGAGLAGIPMLSVAAVMALLAIAIGAILTNALLRQKTGAPGLQPAE